jgi:RNA polymerase sigma-70 factor (ECF subfamily)
VTARAADLAMDEPGGHAHGMAERRPAGELAAPRPTRAHDAPDDAPDPARLRTVFAEHYPAVWRLLRRLGVEPAQIDDAAQQVFGVLARRLAAVEPGKESAYLYGVALRVASSEARRRRSSPPLLSLDALVDVTDDRPSPEAELAARRDRHLLDVALDRMPLPLRSVFVLAELEQLEVAQIAAIEGIAVGTASSRLRRAREAFSMIARRLRAELAHATRSGA